METLKEIDGKFTNHYRQLLEIQREVQQQLNKYSFDLSTTEITDTIIDRMNAFWYFTVNNNKELLNRQSNSVSSDFFTETCQLYFKAYFESNFDVKVYSERSIVEGKNPVKPDISIWSGDNVLAAIELKVNSGWQRKTILDHLETREFNIKYLHPSCQFFAIAFWNFFEDGCIGWNEKFVGLKTFTKSKKLEVKHPRTTGSVENIMLCISNKLQNYNKVRLNDDVVPYSVI